MANRNRHFAIIVSSRAPRALPALDLISHTGGVMRVHPASSVRSQLLIKPIPLRHNQRRVISLSVNILSDDTRSRRQSAADIGSLSLRINHAPCCFIAESHLTRRPEVEHTTYSTRSVFSKLSLLCWHLTAADCALGLCPAPQNPYNSGLMSKSCWCECTLCANALEGRLHVTKCVIEIYWRKRLHTESPC